MNTNQNGQMLTGKTMTVCSWLIFACFALPALAGTSANYTLVPDTVDNGGLRGTSANYTSSGSATPGGAGTSGNYTARTGFAGQLLEAVATAINLTATPPTVNEGGTRQLSAVLVFDDLSSTPLAASSVTWSVQSGPLTGISTTGLATAPAVYQDTAAVARGTYQTFTATINLTVLNILPDNFGSYAGDGLPDDWQVQYFGLNNPLAGPLMDADGDGFDNLFEYNACLIPTDRLSVFSFSMSDTLGGGHQVTFSPRQPGCSYTLLGSSDLVDWAPVIGPVMDNGTLRTIVDPAGIGQRRFYSISVLRN